MHQSTDIPWSDIPTLSTFSHEDELGKFTLTATDEGVTCDNEIIYGTERWAAFRRGHPMERRHHRR